MLLCLWMAFLPIMIATLFLGQLSNQCSFWRFRRKYSSHPWGKLTRLLGCWIRSIQRILLGINIRQQCACHAPHIIQPSACLFPQTPLPDLLILLYQGSWPKSQGFREIWDFKIPSLIHLNIHIAGTGFHCLIPGLWLGLLRGCSFHSLCSCATLIILPWILFSTQTLLQLQEMITSLNADRSNQFLCYTFHWFGWTEPISLFQAGIYSN